MYDNDIWDLARWSLNLMELKEENSKAHYSASVNQPDLCTVCRIKKYIALVSEAEASML